MIRHVFSGAMAACMIGLAYGEDPAPVRELHTRPWLYAYDGRIPSAQLTSIRFSVGGHTLEGDELTLHLGDTLTIDTTWVAQSAAFRDASIRYIIRGRDPGPSPAFLIQKKTGATPHVGETVALSESMAIKPRSLVGPGVLRIALLEKGATWDERAAMFAIPVTVPPGTWESRIGAEELALLAPVGAWATGKSFRTGADAAIDIALEPAKGAIGAFRIFSTYSQDEGIQKNHPVARVELLDSAGTPVFETSIRFAVDTGFMTAADTRSNTLRHMPEPAYVTAWNDDDGNLVVAQYYVADFALASPQNASTIRITHLRPTGAFDVDDIVLIPAGR